MALPSATLFVCYRPLSICVGLIRGSVSFLGEDIVLKPPIVNPTTGQVQESRGYGYLGTTTLVNQVLARTIAGETMAWQDVIANPDSSVYLALGKCPRLSAV